jgi:hypothetical protein
MGSRTRVRLEHDQQPESGLAAGVRQFDGQRPTTAIDLGEQQTAKILLEANITSPLLLVVVALRIGGGGPWWLSGWHGRTVEPDADIR